MATGRGPREVSDPSNIQTRKTASGTLKTDVGNSQFYAKEWTAQRSQGVLLRAGEAEGGDSFGILPVYDSTHDSADSLDNRTHGASIKIKKMTRIYDGSTKFPKLEECAHFHYDLTELGPVQVCLNEENQENLYRTTNGENVDPHFDLKVTSNTKSWTIRRNYENFRMFDKQLHRCIFDRKYSMLPELRRGEVKEDNYQGLKKLLGVYLTRFSSIAGSMINCGPVLSWLEMDNRGNRLIVTDDSAINTPAIAAAHVTKRYNAHANDEISFEVGDIISIIDMPPPEETVWWRGKRGFEVGFFPSEYVEVIGDHVPPSMASSIPETPPKPVLRKRGKLISFLRMFFTTRPTRTTLKRTGIVKERVFGCDLGEHLLNSGHDVPLVLKCCTEVIESQGIVDGIYRLSGVASNIQKLRVEFDEDQLPDLNSETYLQDIHSISSLLKMYFRELPNPLLTYQLYDKFAAAVQDEEHRLMKLHDVVQQLPPPHYRTAEYLIRHLARVATHGVKTGMHCKNLAIVWAPNLLRSKELETSCNVAALQGVGIQAVVTEFLIMYADLIFSDKMPSFSTGNPTGTPKKARPKSLAISTPTRLLSLEEARERALNVASAASPKQKYIDVGGGPDSLPAKYHTVIDWPHNKKSHRKGGKSATATGWRSLFSRGRTHEWRAKQKYPLQVPPVAPLRLTSTVEQALTEEDVAQRRKLRTVKSADSLLSASLLPSRQLDMAEGATGIAYAYHSKSDAETMKMRFPSVSSAATVQSESGMRPLTKRSVSYDMYYSESDMDATDISPSDDVFALGPRVGERETDSASFHSWPHHGATSMDMPESSHRKGVMADLEGRFYPNQRHQRHLSDSESVRSQGSFARSGTALTYVPSKSPTLRSFDGGPSRSPRVSDGSKSPRLIGGSRSPRSTDSSHSPRSMDDSRSPKMDISSGSASRNTEAYNEAVSQILGTSTLHSESVSSSSSGPTPSPHLGSMLSTFHPQPHLMTTSAPAAMSSSPEPPVSPRSPTLRDKIVKALSPPSLRKKLRSPSPPKDQPHSPLSSPPVAKARRSRAKGAQASSPTSPLGESTSRPQHMEQEQSQASSFFTNRECPRGIQETHFDVGPQVKPLSPIGELLPVELTESPGMQRKESGTTWYVDHELDYADSHASKATQELESPESPDQFQVILSSPEDQAVTARSPGGLDGGEVSDYDNDRPETPPRMRPAKPEPRRGEIPVTPSNETYLTELETAERMLAVLGSPQNRMSKALSVPSLSVPSDIQKSRDNLESPADMGSIGSFSELSKSLDSLLNGVSTQEKYTPPQEVATKAGYVAPGGPPNTVTANAQIMSTSHTDANSGPYYRSFSVDSDIQADLVTKMEVAHPTSATPPLQSPPASDSDNLEMSRSTCRTPTNLGELSSHRKRHSRAQRAKEAMSIRLDTDGQVDLTSDTDTDIVQLQEDAQTPEDAPGQDLGMPHMSHTSMSPCSDNLSTGFFTLEDSNPPKDTESTDASFIKQVHHAHTTNLTAAPIPAPRTTLSKEILPASCSATKHAHPTSKTDEAMSSKSSGARDASASSVETRRRNWVHAPKASMEETNIETDSPPLQRKSGNIETDFRDSELETAGALDQKVSSPRRVVAERSGLDQSLTDRQYEPKTCRGNSFENLTLGLQKDLEKPVVSRVSLNLSESDAQMGLEDKSQENDRSELAGVVNWSKPSSEMVCSTGDDEVFSADSEMVDVSVGRTDWRSDSGARICGKSSTPNQKYAKVSSIGDGSKGVGDSRKAAQSQDQGRILSTEGGTKSPRSRTPSKGSQPEDSLEKDLHSENNKEETPERTKLNRHPSGATDSTEKKRHSPKRQKSVRELRSRFETLGGSPPRDQEPVMEPMEEPKFKPLVFQKPKIVHLKALSPTSSNAPCNLPSPPTNNQGMGREDKSIQRSPLTGARSRAKKDLDDESSFTKSPSPSRKLDSQSHVDSRTSDRCDSDDPDRVMTPAEEAEGSERKVRKLSLMFERRNSARSDSLEPPIATLERRKRCDSARSDSSNEPIREENTNIKKERSEHAPSKMQKESDNEKISKQDAKAQEGKTEMSVELDKENENISVRHLSQMFERGRSSRSSSSEPGENGYVGSRGQGQSETKMKTTKPWTAIV